MFRAALASAAFLMQSTLAVAGDGKEGPTTDGIPNNTLIIAYCKDNGAVGVSVKDVEHVAVQLALNSCQASGGGLGCCNVEVRTYIARCGALAQSEEHYGRSVGNSLSEADEGALKECGDDRCSVRAHRCRY
jgi:hypothetical protein